MNLILWQGQLFLHKGQHSRESDFKLPKYCTCAEGTACSLAGITTTILDICGFLHAKNKFLICSVWNWLSSPWFFLRHFLWVDFEHIWGVFLPPLDLIFYNVLSCNSLTLCRILPAPPHLFLRVSLPFVLIQLNKVQVWFTCLSPLGGHWLIH